MKKKGTLLWLLFIAFSCQTPFRATSYCSFKVDLTIATKQNNIKKITCFTNENQFKDSQVISLRVGDMQTDSSFILSRLLKIGTTRSLKKYQTVHIELILTDQEGVTIEKINGEIDRADWICQ